MAKKNCNMWFPCNETEPRSIVKPNAIHTPSIKTLTRAKKEEIDEVKANIKAQLPALTSTGVRRYRVPYHESVLLELKEAGFRAAENYLKRLYEHDDKSGNSEMKKLKEQRHLIERIKYGLMNAELARRKSKITNKILCTNQDNIPQLISFPKLIQDRKIERAIQLLETALFFKSLMPEWFWIADKFFKSALKVSSTIRGDDGEVLNIIKYIYGKFRFYEIKDARGALHLLDEVRKASEGRRWKASKIMKTEEQRYLFNETNLVLNEVLMALAEESKEKDLNSAVETIVGAIKIASDSGKEEHFVKTLFEAAKTQMSAGHISEALQNFSKYLARVKRIPDPNGICDGHRELAFVYKVLKDIEGVERHLNSFKENAEKSGLTARLAEAHYYLGEFELEQGRPSSATSHLHFAFESFKSLEMLNEMDKARFLAGVSKGEELKISYLGLVKKCQENDPEAIMKLFEWKQRRTPFWNLYEKS